MKKLLLIGLVVLPIALVGCAQQPQSVQSGKKVYVEKRPRCGLPPASHDLVPLTRYKHYTTNDRRYRIVSGNSRHGSGYVVH